MERVNILFFLSYLWKCLRSGADKTVELVHICPVVQSIHESIRQSINSWEWIEIVWFFFLNVGLQIRETVFAPVKINIHFFKYAGAVAISDFNYKPITLMLLLHYKHRLCSSKVYLKKLLVSINHCRFAVRKKKRKKNIKTGNNRHRIWLHVIHIKTNVQRSLTSDGGEGGGGLPADVWWEARRSVVSFLFSIGPVVFSNATPCGAQQGYSHTHVWPIWANDNQTAASPCPLFHSRVGQVFFFLLQHQFSPGFCCNRDKWNWAKPVTWFKLWGFDMLSEIWVTFFCFLL